MLLVAMLRSQDSATDIRIDVIATAITCRITIREMIDLNRITLFLGDEVSDAANGMDLYLGTPVGKLLSQAMDINFDSVGGDFPGDSENVVLDLLLGNHAPLAAHQKFEHIGFARRQHLRLIVDRGLTAAQVEFEVGDVKRTSKLLARPAQQRFQSRDQLFERERLDHVVVGTAPQPADSVG